MEYNDQLRDYFGTADLASLPSEALSAGVERMQVDLGLSRDRGQRFALWSMLYMLGSAPELEAVFKNPADLEAARNFMDLVGQAGSD